MKKHKIIIENYKNIKKVEILLDRNITNIVGINGIGKSNILHALRLFDSKLDDYTYANIENKYKKTHSPKVTFEFQGVLDEDWKDMETSLDEILNDKYSIRMQEIETIMKNKESLEGQIKSFHSNYGDNWESYPSQKSQFDEKTNEIKTLSDEIAAKEDLLHSNKNDDYKEFKEWVSDEWPYIKVSEEYHKNDKGIISTDRKTEIYSGSEDIDVYSSEFISETFGNFWKDNIDISHSSDFSKLLIKNEEILEAGNILYDMLAKLGHEEDLENFSNMQNFEISEFLKTASEKMTEYYFSDWEPEKISVLLEQVNKDKKEVSIYFMKENKDDKMRIMPEDSSQGYLWHIALKTLFLNVESKPKLKLIILDEPNNFLHIDAQKSLVNFFEKYTEENPDTFVIYTTHSPFMISRKANYIAFSEIENKWLNYNSQSDLDHKDLNLKALTKFGNETKNIIDGIESLNSGLLNEKIITFLNDGHYEDALNNMINILDDEIINKMTDLNIIENRENELSSKNKRTDRIRKIMEARDDSTSQEKANKKLIAAIEKTVLFVTGERNTSSAAHPIIKKLNKEQIGSICIIIMGLALSIKNL